jgi:hypothetical protein
MPASALRALLLMFALLPLTACVPGSVNRSTPSLEPTIKSGFARPTPKTAPTQAVAAWQPFDLRYAHVFDVSYESLDDFQFRFDVTLVHDDGGEAPQFADWWQVEDLAGNVLGRRILTHSHGSQPFTRSATIAIPTAVELVFIRGHDMLHGFGGQGIQLNLRTGEQVTIMTGP